MIKIPKTELVDILEDLFGAESVDTYEKSTIQVWRDGVLIVMVKDTPKFWIVSLSSALNSYQSAMLTASLYYSFDFVIGPAFLRLSDGSVIEGDAAIIYAGTQIAKAYNEGKIAHTLPLEFIDETLKDGILTNRNVRFIN